MFGLCLEINRFALDHYRVPPIKLPKQVPNHHFMIVYDGLIKFVKNKHELAAVIAHEFGHLELQHTVMPNHNLYREYNADQISVYYMMRAGYNPCAVSALWKRMNQNLVNLKPSSHPLKVSRQFYMKMPNCQAGAIKNEPVTINDAYEIYANISKHVEARIGYRTTFVINFSNIVNAYVYTKMRNVK